MDISLTIADFEMSYTDSFKATAREKYNVDFKNSTVSIIESRLNQLQYNVANNLSNNIKVGFDFTINEVNHIIELLKTIINHYKDITATTNVNSNAKLYYLLNQLKIANNTTKQIEDLHNHFIVTKKETETDKDRMRKKVNTSFAKGTKQKK